VKLSGHPNLRNVGTGNVSVSAVFIHAGQVFGSLAVLLEIGRGVLPVVLGRQGNVPPAVILLGLLVLVVARYVSTRGGGVTNVTWGILAYAPLVAACTACTGLLLWGVGCPRLRAARWGAFSAVLWTLIWRQSWLEFLAILALAAVLLLINVLQADDMTLLSKLQLLSLDQTLTPTQVGEKASHLADLLQAGFPVPQGWVLPPQIMDPTPLLSRLQPPPDLHHPYIVRSSALGEDDEVSSSAGLYTTVADLTSTSEVLTAIQTCRSSYSDPQAVAYRQQRQLPTRSMAVLIQRQVDSKVAGVAFSRNPLDGSPHMVLEALPGRAAVVTGRQTPLHLDIPLTSEAVTLISQPLLPEAVLHQLIQLVKQIEAHFHGLPQDIEWGWDGEQIWILQSRPITNLRPIWTRTIAAEVIPGAIPPLTWSINRPLTCGVWGDIFKLVLGDAVQDLDFTQTATLLGSHAYFNATLLGAIFRQMGLPEQGLEFLLRGGKMGKPPRSAYRQLISCLPGLWRLIQRERTLPQDFAQDQKHHFQPALTLLSPEQLRQLSQQELLALGDQLQDLLQRATFYNIVGPIGLAIRRTLLRVPDAWLQDQTSPEKKALSQLEDLAHQVRQQLSPHPSADEVQAKLSEPTLRESFHQILETYGFLSEVGTDIAVPCWREQPETIAQLLQRQILQPRPSKTEEAPDLHLLQKWRRDRCQDRLDLKGEIATVYAQLLAYLRWTVVELEQRWQQEGVMQEKGDIFFLEWSQVQDLARLSPPERLCQAVSVREQITARRQQWAIDRKRQVPTVVYGSRLPEAKTDRTLPTTAGILAGIPASAGQVEGRVYVFRTFDPAALPTLEEAIVAVVPYTDAGWAPLLVRFKAIVAEVGGQLSHGAILAREYGIPAVMNVEAATQRLQNGQKVRVDGSRGTIELLPEDDLHPDSDPSPG
jgi:pyruvate,water dikinase